MATQSISKLNDDLGYDPVIARIFTFTSALEKGEVVDVIELMIYRLWLQQALVSGHAEDVDAKLASLLRITHLDTFDDVEENAERVFARKAEQWTEESRRVDAQLTNLLYNNSSLRERARHTLLDRIETHRKTVPKKFKTFAHLVITLYAIESKAIYDTAAKADKRFDPRNNFQVTVVTWLRLCGGEPKVEHKVNVLLTTSWTSLQDLLTQLTTNVQLEQMGCPNGLSCAHGRWIYKVQDEGITVDDGELTSEEEYNTMKEIAISQGPDQRILIIHELMDQVKLIVEADRNAARDGEDRHSLCTTSGFRMGPLPLGFQASREGELLDMANVRSFLDGARYVDKEGLSESTDDDDDDSGDKKEKGKGKSEGKGKGKGKRKPKEHTRSAAARLAKNQKSREKQKAIKAARLAAAQPPAQPPPQPQQLLPSFEGLVTRPAPVPLPDQSRPDDGDDEVL